MTAASWNSPTRSKPARLAKPAMALARVAHSQFEQKRVSDMGCRGAARRGHRALRTRQITLRGLPDHQGNDQERGTRPIVMLPPLPRSTKTPRRGRTYRYPRAPRHPISVSSHSRNPCTLPETSRGGSYNTRGRGECQRRGFLDWRKRSSDDAVSVRSLDRPRTSSSPAHRWNE
jgi:hypothetical protein